MFCYVFKKQDDFVNFTQSDMEVEEIVSFKKRKLYRKKFREGLEIKTSRNKNQK